MLYGSVYKYIANLECMKCRCLEKTRNEMLLGFLIGKGTIGLHCCKKIYLLLRIWIEFYICKCQQPRRLKHLYSKY